MLEHLLRPEEAMRELIRVDKNILIITVPNEPWFCLGSLLALKNVSRLGNPIDHINHWTFRGFQRFIQKFLDKNVCYDTSFPWLMVYYDSGK